MARTAEKLVTSTFVLQLMDLLKCKDLPQLEDRLDTKEGKINMSTLRTWSFESSSPETTLEIVAALEAATGLTAKQLLALYRGKQGAK